MLPTIILKIYLKYASGSSYLILFAIDVRAFIYREKIHDLCQQDGQRLHAPLNLDLFNWGQPVSVCGNLRVNISEILQFIEIRVHSRAASLPNLHGKLGSVIVKGAPSLICFTNNGITEPLEAITFPYRPASFHHG